MRFDILTIFPKMLDSYLNESILKRAQKKKLIEIKKHDLRENAINKHGQVDDKPYGGGVGMVLMFEPIYKTLKKIKRSKKSKIILLSAKGKTFDQKTARKFSKMDQLIMICGRYEGIDERVLKLVDQEISIGDFVLTGGELAAGVIIDATSRLIPGILGKDASSEDESFSQKNILEYPQYTRPEKVKLNKKILRVPKVLLSGDHKRIEKWRQEQKLSRK